MKPCWKNFLLYLIILTPIYIGYTYIHYQYLGGKGQAPMARLKPTCSMSDLKSGTQGVAVEVAFWDATTLGIYFTNKYQLSIPYDWEIFDRKSASDKPLLTKSDYKKLFSDADEMNICEPLIGETLEDISTDNSKVVFQFHTIVLTVHGSANLVCGAPPLQ